MNSQAQDLLLAYNQNFIEYGESMPQSVELETLPVGVLGGTASSDGYFEDFTARLGAFVKNYPLLASSYGGSEPHNWQARVITFGSRGYGACSDESSDDELSDDEHNKKRSDKRSEHSDRGSEEEHHLPLTEFGNFIVDAAVGGNNLHPEDRCVETMDETAAEGGSYKKINTTRDGKSNFTRMENSILNFTANK